MSSVDDCFKTFNYTGRGTLEPFIINNEGVYLVVSDYESLFEMYKYCIFINIPVRDYSIGEVDLSKLNDYSLIIIDTKDRIVNYDELKLSLIQSNQYIMYRSTLTGIRDVDQEYEFINHVMSRRKIDPNFC